MEDWEKPSSSSRAQWWPSPAWHDTDLVTTVLLGTEQGQGTGSEPWVTCMYFNSPLTHKALNSSQMLQMLFSCSTKHPQSPE